MGKKLRISENEVKNGCHPLFRKFVNIVGTLKEVDDSPEFPKMMMMKPISRSLPEIREHQSGGTQRQ